MRIYAPDYLKDFKCLADQCPDTCCSGWEIVLDPDALARYTALPEPLKSRIGAAMDKQDGDTVFRLRENGDCPFLDEKHLCRIYTALGNEGLCFPCRTYPRIFEEFGLLREINLSLSCPMAADLILGGAAPISFTETETDEPLKGCNEIDPDFYRELVPARQCMISILQGRHAMPVAERASIALCYAQELQEAIDRKDYSMMHELTRQYQDAQFLLEEREALKKYAHHPEARQRSVMRYFELLGTLDPMKPDWMELMAHTSLLLADSAGELDLFAAQNDRYNELFQEEDYRFEHLMVYFVYRYMMRAVDDRDIYTRIKFTIFSFLVIRQLLCCALSEGIPLCSSKMVELSRRYSREIEHSTENMQMLKNAIRGEHCFEIRQLLWTLLG